MRGVTEVQSFTACTIDGFIADENNSLDWLFEVPHDADDGYWDQWFPSVGGLAMGATTYEWMVERHRMVTARRNGTGSSATGRGGSSLTATCR
jgi:dihydrofolate reductase